MKKLSFAIFLLFFSIVIMAQTTMENTISNESESSHNENDIVFVVVESMPEFPGGQQTMMRYIAENIQYPVIAQLKGIQGRVVCQFVIEKDGRVTDVQVVRSSGEPSLDIEAVRVVNSMPNWKPGKQRDKLVRVKYTMPINFKLKPKEKEPIATLAAPNSDENIPYPQFPGGYEKLNEYVKTNIRYPKAAFKRGIRGKVVVEFTVDIDGTILNAHVVEAAPYKSLNDEAIRLVNAMPKWTPAQKGGQPIQSTFAFPIGFGVK